MDFDDEKIQKIIVNLLSNAVKYTIENGHIHMFVGSMATKENQQAPSFLTIDIVDEGVGIPDEKLPFIFDRFYQVDSSSTRKHEGSGIGLALVKELVRILEGKISVTSNNDKKNNKTGTKFTISLPITSNAPKTITPITSMHRENFTVGQSIRPVLSASEENGLERLSHKPNILIVEDNLDVITYMISFLQDHYNITTA